MKKHYLFTLCPLSITAILNFNTVSKVAFCCPVKFYLYSNIMPLDT